ncbi:hypothetical protein C8Q79DRAFT_392475 [Trametes meyenii]|nr:hypothetical protein C8Q79DRAFT_392475 [Trametes meyenii]
MLLRRPQGLQNCVSLAGLPSGSPPNTTQRWIPSRLRFPLPSSHSIDSVSAISQHTITHPTYILQQHPSLSRTFDMFPPNPLLILARLPTPPYIHVCSHLYCPWVSHHVLSPGRHRCICSRLHCARVYHMHRFLGSAVYDLSLLLLVRKPHMEERCIPRYPCLGGIYIYAVYNNATAVLVRRREFPSRRLSVIDIVAWKSGGVAHRAHVRAPRGSRIT